MSHAARSSYRSPRDADELTRRNVEAMRQLETLAKAQRGFSDRMAEFVATFCGSISFVWIHAVLFVVWIAWNALPGLPHFDPYPFTFLTLCVSLEAITRFCTTVAPCWPTRPRSSPTICPVTASRPNTAPATAITITSSGASEKTV